MFSDATAAQRRVQAIERAGLSTTIDERKQSVQEHWVSAEVAAQAPLPAASELGIAGPTDAGMNPPAWDNC
jgi:hypothetical protein